MIINCLAFLRIDSSDFVYLIFGFSAFIFVACAEQSDAPYSNKSVDSPDSPVSTDGNASDNGETMVEEEGQDYLRALKNGDLNEAEIAEMVALLHTQTSDRAVEFLAIIQEILGRNHPLVYDAADRVVTCLAGRDELERAIEIGREYLQSGQVLSSEVNIALSRLSQTDPGLAEMLLLKWPPGEDRDSLMLSFAASLVTHGQLDQAKDLIAGIESSKVRKEVAREAAWAYVSNADPADYEAFIRTEVTAGESEWANAVFQKGIERMAYFSEDKDRILEVLKLSPNDEVLHSAIEGLARSRFLTERSTVAADAIELVEEGTERSDLFQLFARSYVRTDVEAAKDWFNSLSSEVDRIEAFKGIASAYIQVDPSEFVRWFHDEKYSEGYLEVAVAELRRRNLTEEVDELVEYQSN